MSFDLFLLVFENKDQNTHTFLCDVVDFQGDIEINAPEVYKADTYTSYSGLSWSTIFYTICGKATSVERCLYTVSMLCQCCANVFCFCTVGQQND